ncbi:MAG TPA: hypothetical protein VHE35_16185 [Kofleriaceae bacterium]|nr:hypothetical protein [Kofleriaceae bacterium]
MSLALAAVLLAAGTARVAAGPLTADQHRDAGYRDVERGDWDAAIHEYETAYDLDHDPVSLYAIGRVYAQRGDCAPALEAFHRFVDSGPPPKARASAEAEIAKCEAVLAAAAPPDATTAADTSSSTAAAAATAGSSASAGEPTAAAPSPAAPPPHRRPFYRDAVGGLLVGGGAVAGGLGLYFYVHARGELCDDPCTGSYQAYQDRLARAHTWRTRAVIAGGVGAGLVVAGVLRWVTHRDHAERADLAWSPRPGGGALTLTGRF